MSEFKPVYLSFTGLAAEGSSITIMTLEPIPSSLVRDLSQLKHIEPVYESGLKVVSGKPGASRKQVVASIFEIKPIKHRISMRVFRVRIVYMLSKHGYQTVERMQLLTQAPEVLPTYGATIRPAHSFTGVRRGGY